MKYGSVLRSLRPYGKKACLYAWGWAGENVDRFEHPAGYFFFKQPH